MTNRINVAMVGLGRVGGAFLEELMCLVDRGVHIAAAVEPGDTPARSMAEMYNIPVVDMDALIAMGDGIDVLFDLTGSDEVRRGLREKLATSGNRHTVIAPETVARLLWLAMADDARSLPSRGGHSGY